MYRQLLTVELRRERKLPDGREYETGLAWEKVVEKGVVASKLHVLFNTSQMVEAFAESVLDQASRKFFACQRILFRFQPCLPGSAHC